MKSPIVLLAVVAAGCCVLAGAFVAPRNGKCAPRHHLICSDSI